MCQYILDQNFFLSVHGDSLALEVLSHDQPQGFSQSDSADYQAKINIKHKETKAANQEIFHLDTSIIAYKTKTGGLLCPGSFIILHFAGIVGSDARL